MSLSVTGSNTSNPFALFQSLWPQSSSANGTQGQSDPLSSLLAALGQQNPGANSSTATSSGASTSGASTSGASSTNGQFGSQTLQALLALQTDSANPQTLASQFANAVNDADPTASQQSGASQGQGGRHHHHMDGAGGSGGQSLLSLLSGASGTGTSQTTANANGTTTTSITYADGSTVSMTSAASGTSGSDTTTASAGGANVAGGNMLERLIQMQAQLLAPAATQSVTA